MIEVIDPGLLLTLQDSGRKGFAHLGVPRSGAADMDALEDANRIVGNDRAEAVFETTLVGAELLFQISAVVAVTGADAEVCIDGESAGFGEAIVIPEGTTLKVGAARSCVRSCIAVRGGLSVPQVLGSVSSDLLTGLGSAPLGRGDRVGIAANPTGPLTGARVLPATRPARIQIEEGPQAGSPEGRRLLRELTSLTWQVTPDSNRVGLRLAAADGTLEVGEGFELARSQPLVPGAVQLPPGGGPIVMLRDHPVTGGYPVLGVVTSDGLNGCARLRPGDTFRFAIGSDPS